MGELARSRQLADAELVQDLARLHVPLGVVLGRLPVREDPRVSRAMSGMNGRTSSDVMMLSRPNSVANHGTPAAT